MSLRARFRLFRGICPACLSRDPQCLVCEGTKATRTYASKRRRNIWRDRYLVSR